MLALVLLAMSCVPLDRPHTAPAGPPADISPDPIPPRPNRPE